MFLRGTGVRRKARHHCVRRSGSVVAVALMAAAVLYLGIGIQLGVKLYDEGTPVYGALRVLDGEVPYRDFWTVYPPGQLYLLAAVFSLFGVSLMADRVIFVITVATVALLVYLIGRRLAGVRSALLGWLLFVVLAGWYRPFGAGMPTGLALALLGSLLLVESGELPTARVTVASGLLVGIAALFRQDVAVYASVAHLLMLWLRRFSAAADRTARAVVQYLAGVVAPVFIVGTCFLAVVPVAEMFQDLIVFPVTVYPRVRGLPWPPLLGEPSHVVSGHAQWGFLGVLPVYFPLIACGVALIVLLKTGRPSRWRESGVRHAVMVLVLGLLLLTLALVRSDKDHAFPAWATSAILLAIVVARAGGLGWSGVVLRAGAGLLTVALIAPPIVGRAAVIRGLPSLQAFEVRRARGIAMGQSSVEPYQAALRYVMADVPPGERIFVGNTRHDRVVESDPMFYVLAERHSATKYHELYPGLVTTHAVQQIIVDELERRCVRLIVLHDERGRAEPNASSVSSGVTLLDTYIRARFAPVAIFGDHSVWKRKP